MASSRKTTGRGQATLYDKLNFNFIRDIAPGGGIIRLPQRASTNPSLPVKTIHLLRRQISRLLAVEDAAGVGRSQSQVVRDLSQSQSRRPWRLMTLGLFCQNALMSRRIYPIQESVVR